VFSAVVDEATSSMQRRLVDSGLFQSVSLSYLTLDHAGPISLFARTTPDNVVRALSELGVELYLFGDPAYFDAEDLAAAKKTLRVDAAIGRESVSSAAHELADYWAVAGLAYDEAYEDGLQSVTVDDVRSYLDRYIVGRPKVIAAVATADIKVPLASAINEIVRRWPQPSR
jgi:zinc protease